MEGKSKTSILEFWEETQQRVKTYDRLYSSETPTKPQALHRDDAQPIKKRKRKSKRQSNPPLLSTIDQQKMLIQEEIKHNLTQYHAQGASEEDEESDESSHTQELETPGTIIPMEIAQETNIKGSIFFREKQQNKSNVFRDRDVSDILSLLCLDTPIHQIDTPTDELTIIAPEQRFTESEFTATFLKEKYFQNSGTSSLPTEIEEIPQTPDAIFNQLINPNHSFWNNDEFVCGWMLSTSSKPLKLLKYFKDIDEIAFFLTNLRKRGAMRFSIPIDAEHARGWSINMLSFFLHGGLLQEFKEFIESKEHRFLIEGERRLKRSDRDERTATQKKDLLSQYLLVTMNPPFDNYYYISKLRKLGIVPFPDRPTFHFDFCDISLVLTSIAKAWKSWNFWYGMSFSEVEKDKSYFQTNLRSFNCADKSFLSNKRTVSPQSTTNKDFLIHIRGLMSYLDSYIYWIDYRLSEICTHKSVDPTHGQVKEHIFYISGMLSLFQSFVNYYQTLFEENNFRLIKQGTNLKQFVFDIYTHSKKHSSCEKKKRWAKETALSAVKMLPNPGKLARSLREEIISLAAHDTLGDDIIETIEHFLQPLFAKIQYHSRSGGHGANSNIAVRESLPRSAQANQQEFMEMVEGSLKKLEDGLPPDQQWTIEYAVQVKAIDTCFSQLIPNFVWSKEYLIDETQLSKYGEDHREWPKVSTLGSTTTTEDFMKKHPKPRRETPVDIHSFFKFKCKTGGGYRNIQVVRIGCFFVLQGYGHTLCTPCFTEAFIGWTALKETYEGWLTEYTVFSDSSDATKKSKIIVSNLENATRYILHEEFKEKDTFRDDIDEEVLKRLDTRIGADRMDSRAALSESDLNTNTQKISSSKNVI